MGLIIQGSTCVLVKLHCKVYVWKVRLFDMCPSAKKCISQPNVGHSGEHTDKECSGTMWVVGSLLVGLPCISEYSIWGFGPQLEHLESSWGITSAITLIEKGHKWFLFHVLLEIQLWFASQVLADPLMWMGSQVQLQRNVEGAMNWHEIPKVMAIAWSHRPLHPIMLNYESKMSNRF